MALRLVEITIPNDKQEPVKELIEAENPAGMWSDRLSEHKTQMKVLFQANKTEALLDKLERALTGDDYRIILLPVEATLPRIKIEDEEKEKKEEKESEKKSHLRVSREELYTEIKESASLNSVFVAMVVLSTIVASIGLLKDNVAVIIGAMVIAPLLGPNVGLALATTLGDFQLAKHSLKTNIVGIAIAFLLSFATGYFLRIKTLNPELLARTSADLSDIALAIATGIAGALAFTSGLSATLIGVMVAVALLPPLASVGILAGSGFYKEALGALILLGINLISINLSGVATFYIQGVQPRRWFEARKAKKATLWALFIWTILIAVLVILLLFR